MYFSTRVSEIVAESRSAENRDATTKDIEFSVTLSQPPATNTDSGANATLAGEEYKASADAVGGAARFVHQPTFPFVFGNPPTHVNHDVTDNWHLSSKANQK